jgi:hypothetical protein
MKFAPYASYRFRKGNDPFGIHNLLAWGFRFCQCTIYSLGNFSGEMRVFHFTKASFFVVKP